MEERNINPIDLPSTTNQKLSLLTITSLEPQVDDSSEKEIIPSIAQESDKVKFMFNESTTEKESLME